MYSSLKCSRSSLDCGNSSLDCGLSGFQKDIVYGTWVPSVYETSELIVPDTTEEIRPQKRYRIKYDQANVALEAPAIFGDAIKSPEAGF